MKKRLHVSNPFCRYVRGRKFRHSVSALAAIVAVIVIVHCIPALVLLDIKAFIMYHIGMPTDTMIYANEKYRVMHYDTPRIKYLINNPGKCTQSDPFAIIFVKSHPEHFKERESIRKTWGNIPAWGDFQKNTQPIVLFMLGVAKDHSETLQASLVEENNMHHDMIQESFIEGFHNLTVKLVSQYKWPVLFCNRAKFWMTTDDDVFINVKNLVSHLNSIRQESLFLGLVHAGSPSNKDVSSKYYVPEFIYRGSYYPPYCPGAGYVLSMDVVEKLYRKALHTPLLYIDDAYTGILAHAVGVVPTHYVMFLGEKRVPSDLCTLSKFITSHPHKGEEMFQLYQEVINLSSVDPDIVCWDRLFSWIHPNDIVYF